MTEASTDHLLKQFSASLRVRGLIGESIKVDRAIEKLEFAERLNHSARCLIVNSVLKYPELEKASDEFERVGKR